MENTNLKGVVQALQKAEIDSHAHIYKYKYSSLLGTSLSTNLLCGINVGFGPWSMSR